MNEPSAGERTALYRCFAADETLLYVGIANRLGRRWDQHAKAQPWWPLVDGQTVRWLPSREEAKSAEDAAIATESPRFNIVGSTREAWGLDDETGFYVGPKRVQRPQHRDDLPLMYHGDGSQWPHERVAGRIESAIASGEYPPGSKLPSQSRIAAEAGVSTHTVSAAIALLREKGTVYTRSRLGTFASPSKG